MRLLRPVLMVITYFHTNSTQMMKARKERSLLHQNDSKYCTNSGKEMQNRNELT